MASMWPYHALLPDVIIDEERQVEEKKEQALHVLNGRIDKLEEGLKPTTLGQVAPVGFEINTTTVLVGIIVGLVVYVLVSSHYESQRPTRQWWQW